MAQRTPVVFALEGETAVLQPEVSRELAIGEALDRHAICEGVRLERVYAVRQLDLRRVRRRPKWRIPALAAGFCRKAELRCQMHVVLEVAEAVSRPELARRRLPAQAAAVPHVTRVVRLDGAELAEVVRDADVVHDAWQHLAGHPDAGGEASAKKLLGHLPVGARPEGPGALHGPRGQVRRQSDAEGEGFVDTVLQVAEEQRLLRRRQR